MQEKRVETRYLCSDLVRPVWSEGHQRQRDETVVLKYLRLGRLRAGGENPVAENSRVRLACREQEFHGYVRSCYWRDDGYFLGIACDAGSKWSRPNASRSICSLPVRSSRAGQNRW